jgi:aminoglycoside phosphotransferase (APT) family kinase protein
VKYKRADQLPYGWSHGVWRVAEEAHKLYTDDANALELEASILRALTGRLPVPHVVDTSAATLRMSFVAGLNGQPALETASAGDARQMLRLAGALLHQVHAVPHAVLPDELGIGSVLVHGDFSLYNLIYAPDRSAIRALVDWERAHLGEQLEDLAWFEWTMRKWWPPRLFALTDFFAAYGARPTWSARQDAMVSCIERHIARIAPRASTLVPKWQEFLEEVRTFDPLDDD